MRWLIYVCTPANLRINYLQPCPYWVMELLCAQNNCSLPVIHLLCLFPKNASVAVLVPKNMCSWTGLVYYYCFPCWFVMDPETLNCRKHPSMCINNCMRLSGMRRLFYQHSTMLIQTPKTRQEGSMCLVLFWFKYAVGSLLLT